MTPIPTLIKRPTSYPDSRCIKTKPINKGLYNLTLTSTHGIVHSRLPSKLRNHSNPTPVHSCSSAAVAPVVVSLSANLCCTPSTAAPANALVVEFTASNTYPANPPSWRGETVCSGERDETFPALAVAVVVFCTVSAEEETKGGENQSRRRSKKQ